MSFLRPLLLGLALATITAPALAQSYVAPRKPPITKSAPEIDSAAIGGALAVAVGGAFLVGARMKRRRNPTG